MTLKDLIDISETKLIVGFGGYDDPLIEINELDIHWSEDFVDILSPEIMNRKVESIKSLPDEQGIRVSLEAKK